MELKANMVVKVLRGEYDEWIATLSDREKYAIEKYSWNSFDKKHGNTSFFVRINAMLRGIASSEMTMLSEYADIISNAISKHPIQHAVVCYRGSDFDISNGADVDEVFESLQFISTSVIKSRKFDKRYEYIIHVPEGASAAYIEKLSVYKKQKELLINKNTFFRVVARNGYLIELEVIA